MDAQDEQNESGITEKQLKIIKRIPELRFLGCFETAEKQSEAKMEMDG